MTDQELSSSQRLLLTLKKARAKIDRLEREPIAIIGMGCRFPGGANNLEQFWQLLAQGQDAIVEVPASRWSVDEYYDPQQGVLNKTYAKDAGYLQHPIEEFDPQFFGMAPLEAQHLDPQHRLLLEVTWEALENANLPADKLPVATGIYLGIMDTETATYDDSYDVYATTGTGTAMASGRLAYTLGVQGPNVSINTVCSSSLVALHLACQGLRASECEVAICGGVNILLTPDSTIALSQMQAISPDGRCKTFSAQADGYGRGEGCGMVVLKLLSDAVEAGDNIWAVIHGSAVNHNGPSSGLTVPNKVAQVTLLQQALAKAYVEGQQMSYVEAHGTGTKLGDPIELNALAEALGKRNTSLFIGSVKTNIGHLEAAAGIAGVIKVALSLHHQAIPPHLHFHEPSPYMDWANLPFQVPTALTPWPRGEQPRYAGVSSFGLSGTNSHAILGEAPLNRSKENEVGSKPTPETVTPYSVLPTPHILTLSGKTEQALHDQVAQYREYLSRHTELDLADVCYTAHTGRVHFNHRLAVVAENMDELIKQLSDDLAVNHSKLITPNLSLKTAFLFTGQGSQYVDMGRELYETQPLFHQIMQQCDELLRPHLDVPLLEVIFGNQDDTLTTDRLNETKYTQPALFALEYALAKLWQSWGIKPELVMGHSVGEYAAACLAGVFSLEDGLKLITARGRLMQGLPERGGMVAVQLDEARLLPYLEKYAQQVSIASYNAPRSLVISGQSAALEQIVTKLQAEGMKCTSLTVSHAFHSPLMTPMLAEFERVAKSITYHAPQIELISNLTGQVVTVIDAAYWVKHISAPVRFAQGITAAAELEVRAFIEIGPKPTLISLGQQSYEALKTHNSALITPLWLPSLYPKQMSDMRQMLETLGRLYEHGAKVDWHKVDAPRQKVLLPTYPFQRKRYWLDRKLQKSAVGNSGHALLGSRLPALATNSEIAFQNQLSATAPFYLNDHRIFSQTIFPGAAYVEMILAAGTEIFEGEAFSLADITFQNALVLTEQTTIVQVILTSQDEGYRWQLFSWHEEQKEWLLHGAGQLSMSNEQLVMNKASLTELQDRCTQEISLQEYYQNLAEQGLEYGPEFQAIEQLYQSPFGDKGATEALGLVRLSPSLQLEAKNYHLHPALLDACLQVSAATLPVDPEITFLPFAIEHVWLHRSGAEGVWAYAKHQGSKEVGGNLRLDITLLTEAGEVVAEIIGLTVRPMNRQALVGRKLRTDWLYEVTWQDSPLPQQSPFSHEKGTWLIINPELQGFENLVALSLAELLRAKGEKVVMSDELGVMNEAYRGVIYLAASQELQGFENLAALNTPDATLQLSTQALTVVQQLIKATPKPQLWLITKSGDELGVMSDELKNTLKTHHSSLLTSSLWGLGKTLMWEHPELNCRCIDMDGATTAEILFKAIWQADEETQIKLHNGQRQVARLTRLTPEEIERRQPPYPFQAQLQHYGLLDTLKLSPAQRRAPELYQVEVEMHAVGINFRDVLNALGMLKEYYAPELGYDDPKKVPFGFEGAGRIVAIGSQVTHLAVGDEVIVWDCWGALASHVMVDCDNVTLKPSHLSFEEAATIPITFMTAYYGLHDLAQIQTGDRVLIHAAAGGVGQAAIQLAQLAGAEVLATASPPKWEFLKANGIEHIMNSRTLEFADQIPTLTHGHGVDIVLNSLNGDFIPKSFDVLAAGGRFIEISKIDTWSQQQAAEYRPDVAYHPFDLNLTLESTRETLRTRLLELFNHQQLKPLPYHTFSIDQIGAAFQFMAQAKNIGKVVIKVRHEKLEMRNEKFLTPHFSPLNSYLITGGLGGLGLKVATWLAEQGARHLVLSGRQGAESVAAQQAVAELETLGAKVTVIKADVSQEADVARLIAQSQALAPLRGIIHAAGVIDDGLLHQQTPDRFAKVFAPKVAGSWYLHQLSQDLPLDFFVCFSSAASLLGNAGQANYAAANAFMDSLMAYRQAQGLPGLSLNWGGWSEVGMAEREKAKGREKLEDLISPEQGIDLFAYLLPQNLVQVGILPFRWATTFQHAPRLPFIAHLLKAKTKAKAKTGLGQQWVEVALEERLALLKQHISQEIEFILGLAPAPDQGFFDLGLDSLTSIQLANRLTVNLEVPLPTTIALEYPTVERLATHLAESVLGWHAQPEPIKATPLPVLTRQMMTVDEAQLMALSADEIEAAIAAKLAYLDSLLDE